NLNIVVTSLAMSPDARFIAFSEGPTASNNEQVYLFDRTAGRYELESVAPDGTPGDSASSQARVSADGRYVIFESLSTNLGSSSNFSEVVYLRDRQTGTTIPVSDPQEFAASPSLSDNGNLVAYWSESAA